MASTILVQIKYVVASNRISPKEPLKIAGLMRSIIRVIKAKTMAAAKLVKGPAMVTRNSSRRGFLNAEGLIWTGFAQPNRAKINSNNPSGSIWAIGLNVNRPCCFGVISPKATATRA